MPGTPGANPNPPGGSNPSAAPAAQQSQQQNVPNPTQQTQTASAPKTPDFSTNKDSGIEIQAVNPPLTPDQIIGIYETPFNKSYSYNPFALPSLKLDSVKSPNIKNKTIQEHLKSIEAKMASTEKLMKNIIKLQNLNILTEREVSQRKTELYQNTFEEYILDKSIDFGKKKKSCTCINLPENLPQTGGAPITPPGPPTPTTNPKRQTQTQTQTQTQGQQQRVPQTQGKSSPAPIPAPVPTPTPSPERNWQLPNIPFFPPVRELIPEGLMGFQKSFQEKTAFLDPIQNAVENFVNSPASLVVGAGFGAQVPKVMGAVNAARAASTAVPSAAKVSQPANNVINAFSKPALVPRASGAVGDLELYNSESQNYFRKISNQIASDIPLGPHTPLPHPGYVRPQGGYIPRPNLRGMPNPMGKPMPWGWQPTLLSKGGFVKPYAGGGWLNQLGKFLPGTGTVMAPKGMSLGFQDKLLGIPLGRRELPLNKTYKQQDVDRYNRAPTAPSNITTFGGEGPLSNRHISIPKSRISRPVNPSTTMTRSGSGNRRLDAAIQNARDITNIPGAEGYKPLVESAASSTIKRQEYYDKLREAMKQSGMSGADKSMTPNGTPISSANIEPVSTSDNKFTRLEQTQSNLMASNQTATPKMIPLPPDYIKIPSSKKKETNDDTMAPPPSINPPSSIFSRTRSTVG